MQSLPLAGTSWIEDPMDRHLHRPLARRLVTVLLRLRVTGNQATLARLLSGWAAGYFLWRGFFEEPSVVSWALAAGLLFVSMVLDCADGQLARARGDVTPLGRILDGVADVLVIVPFYAILAAGVLQVFGGLWLAVSVVAGCSFWAHSIIHDKMKSLYAVKTEMTTTGHARATRAPHARVGPLRWPNRFLLAVYAVYLRVQEALAPAGRFNVDQERGGVRWAGLLGLGTHTFVLYTGVALMVADVRFVLVVQVVYALLFNTLLFVVLMKLHTPDRSVDQPVSLHN